MPSREYARLASATGAVLVAVALRVGFDARVLALVSLGAGAAIAAAVLAGNAGSDASATLAARPWVAPVTRGVLALGLTAGLLSHLFLAPGVLLDPPQPAAFRVLAAVAAIGAATGFMPWVPPAFARWRFPVLLACFAAMGTIVLRASPSPTIDVFMFQQGGASALARGANPYRLVFPNVYGDAAFYGPAFLQDGRVVVYPYPPLTALLGLPSYLAAGDVRWMLLACLLLAGWAIRHAGGPLAELAALLVLFQPVTFVILQLAWTEPMVLAAWTFTLLLVARRSSGVAVGIAAGLLIASKQYAPLFALPLAFTLPQGGRARPAAVAIAVLAAVTLPFVAWDPAEFWRDVVVAQLLQPFRDDGLSWLAAWARATGRQPAGAIGYVLAAIALAVGLRRRPSVARAAVLGAAAFLVLLLFSTQGMFNYYWLAVGLLASVCALSERVSRSVLSQNVTTAIPSRPETPAARHPHHGLEERGEGRLHRG